MTRTPTALVLRALPLTLSLILVPGTAFGTSGGSPPVLLPQDSTQLYDTNVPRDGVVAGLSECGPCSMEDVWITTADGTLVEGVVTDLSDLYTVGAWAFTPSSAWQPGEYFAHYADGEPAPFTVLDALVSPPVVEPSLTSIATADVVQCVSQAPTAENPAGEFETFSLKSWTSGLFSPEVSGTSRVQYTYTTSVNDDVLFDQSGASVFEIMAGTVEICYWVRAQRLVSREETLLVDECYSPSELDEYAVENSSHEELLTFLRDKCVLPPGDFVPDWCSSFQSAIDAGDCSGLGFMNVEGCESALNLCGEGEPGSNLPGPGDDPGGSSGGASMDGESDATSSKSRRDSDDSSGGCAILVPRSPTPMGGDSAVLAILATIASVLLRRTRKYQTVRTGC